MNKNDLIDRLAQIADIQKAVAGRVLEGFIGTVTESLSKGEPVVLVGFGTFDVSQRNERTGRNPRTGETITIPATKVPRFKAGKNLKEAINK